MVSSYIHVAVAVIYDSVNQSVLISQRAKASHQGGLWEFPGGKVEADESVEDALKREIHEELDLSIKSARPLIQIKHDYSDKPVFLDVFLCDQWEGQAKGKEGQPVQWVGVSSLSGYDFPAANIAIISAVQLADKYFITHSDGHDKQQFLAVIENVLKNGIRLFQFRVDKDTCEDYEQLARAALRLAIKYNARMLVNSDEQLLKKISAHGLHMKSDRVKELSHRPDEIGLLAVSCHDIGDLHKAVQLNADFALLSPVLPTKSHPDMPALGWENFKNMITDINIPVYALGGMSPEDLEVSFEHGAQGIAAIRGLA